MARRKSTKMSRVRNIEPSPLTLTFIMPAVEPGVTHRSYIDLSQCASLAARRFYRQGLNWAVSGIKVSSSEPGEISVRKLPNTWVLSAAWKKSFATWQKMNREALAESSSIRPRFLDFKVFADTAHHQSGIVGNLLPISEGGAATAGEWESSKIYIPIASDIAQVPGDDTMADFELIAVGASYPGVSPVTGLDAVSCIEGYASSRGLPNVLDPNAPGDAADSAGLTPENWMTAVFNEGETQSHEVVEDMITENNIAPYPFENDGVNLDTMYPGGANQLSGLEIHDIARVFSTSGTTNVGLANLKGGSFACGLMAIEWLSTLSAGAILLQVNMIPGSHRGYLAEPMQDM